MYINCLNIEEATSMYYCYWSFCYLHMTAIWSNISHCG